MEKRFCVKEATLKGLDTAVEINNELKNSLGIKVNDNTVSRALKSSGFNAIEKESKPFLSAKNIKARLKFAKEHKNWTKEEWNKITWSDESKINRVCSDGRYWCWVRDDSSRELRHVKKTLKHGGGSLMIWGCMTAYGRGFMCKIDGKMDKHQYKSILENNLSNTIRYFNLNEENIIFQHDNDPKHKSNLVKNWLNNQPYQVLDWPAQSPDLNPIEHL